MEEDLNEPSRQFTLAFSPYKRMRCPVCKNRNSLHLRFRWGMWSGIPRRRALIVTMGCSSCWTNIETKASNKFEVSSGLISLYEGFRDYRDFLSQIYQLKRSPCPVCQEKKLRGKLTKKRTVDVSEDARDVGWERNAARIMIRCSSCGARGQSIATQPLEALEQAIDDFHRFPERVARRLMGKERE